MQKLGQHFLKNKVAISKIVAALNIEEGDVIIEIGPGKGALTLPMAESFKLTLSNFKIIAIEKDRELATELKNKVQNLKLNGVEIIEGDALKVLPKIVQELKIKNLKFNIVGNIPYYITGKLLRIISELEYKPKLTVIMVQKEVAERIAAQPKPSLRVLPKQSGLNEIAASQTPSVAALRARPRNDRIKTVYSGMNLLAAATQFWAEPEIIFKLKPTDFEPAPDVDSAVIRLITKKEINSLQSVIASKAKRSMHHEIAAPQTSRNDKIKNENLAKEIENYYKLIHTIFKQPRKTLLNNLRSGSDIPKEQIEKALGSLDLPLNSRPQNLSVNDILKLASIIKDL
ncbi:MAG: hypothetical protein M1155_00275 [Patescibacteria group bacterium]|nr:hypothetical protein [Patescibacteria group bacterium]